MSNKNPSDVKKQKILDSIMQYVAVSPDPKHIRKQLFRLTREVKTIAGFDKPIDDSYKKVVESWHRHSGIHLEHESFDILWAQFKTSWSKIKFSTDRAIFFNLFEIAEQSQYPLICNEYNDIAKELIRFCAVLDSHWSPDPFYLSCRLAEEIYGFSHAKMAKLLELFVLDGVLELVKKGSMGRASRYKFLEDKGKIDMGLIETSHQLNKELL